MSATLGPQVAGSRRAWPSVAAVVATRGGRPELLSAALRSILGQRYAGGIECLVVFDQLDPVDPDVDVPDGRSLTLLRNVRRPGLAGGRNTGILTTDADLVAFCDDDDEWLPDKIRREVEALEAGDGEFAATGMELVSGNGVARRVGVCDRISFAELLRSRVHAIHPSSYLIRREALLDGIGLVDEDLPGSYGEDYDLALRAARRRPIVVVPEALVRVRWTGSSWFATDWATIVRAVIYLLDRYPEFSRDRAGLARLRGRVAFAQAALGDRRRAARWAVAALRANVLERRAYLALAVAARLVSAPTLLRLANRAGKGI